jgi:hypothetical protein
LPKEKKLGTLIEYEHTFVLERPASVDEILIMSGEVIDRWKSQCGLWVIGWWEVWNWGEGIGDDPAYIAYPRSNYYVKKFQKGWMLTENRGHWLRPPPEGCTAYWAIEGVQFGYEKERQGALLPIETLEPGSPIGYGPTRMFPMEDVGTHGYTIYPERYEEYVEKRPDPYVLEQLQATPNGAIFWQPSHSIHIDRVWHYLAHEQGLLAQRDIEAYAIGWWQERNPYSPAVGGVYLAFDTPQRLWGFHHPTSRSKTAWMYWYDWFTDMKPLPKTAGPAVWAVEYVRKGEQPTLQTVDLVSEVPQRLVHDIFRKQHLTDEQITSVGGDLALVSPQGEAILQLPIRELAGMFWSQDVDVIARQAWECALWVTQHPVAGEPLPVSMRRYHASRWERGIYGA